ncbi:succinate dehydrogenase cytochrome b subunit [Phytomonospora sp. NPDC050363]|uniref:succinate dehydrogenase cytochrome b subunit n=1 Tax=Phytomonospora sp. NPDC050363 TaxID=3155642 RepID=UPI0033C995CA
MDLATRRHMVGTTVGKKVVMAVTGVMLILFLFLHMLGNLKVFAGGLSFDHYAHWLRTIGAPVLPETVYLWIQRVVLLAAVLGHIWSATALALRARAARPVKYAHRNRVQGSYAARTMRWGGVIIVLFVVYHILDLTTGHLNPVGDGSTPYANVVADFAPERWYVTAFYVLAVLALGFHLRHGIFSAMRSLGQRTPAGERRARFVALGAAVVLCAGFLTVPLAVTTGLIT